MKEVITRSDVPSPSLPFSAGIRANGFIFTAGQVGTDPRTGQLAGPDVASQTRQTIDNLRAVLEAGGSSLTAASRPQCQQVGAAFGAPQRGHLCMLCRFADYARDL